MEPRELCMKLLESDSEEEVIQVLRDAGYWEDRNCWRYFGDVENNWSTIGNQQASPYASLVEKVVNSVDATLMGKCYEAGYAPDSAEAPRTMREAVARFYDPDSPEDAPHAGLVRNWPADKRTRIAQDITLVATGSKKAPSFTIADQGEGQLPDDLPETLMSLAKSNKMRIKFVQGKFNMGGTGVFKFCGQRSLQLVITKRNPAGVKGYTQDKGKWSFTVVRREDPERGRRSSVCTYLAPLGAEDGLEGGVLRFAADELPIFPDFSATNRSPYARMAPWGTVIKLYEYQLPAGGRSNILMRDGLLRRLDVLLPDTALPVRLYEARDFGGKSGSSFANTLTGLSVRLDDDKTNNLEFPPSSCPLRTQDEEMTATIYAFKKRAASTYRNDEGIIFTQNGQTHGHITPAFFRRKRVGMSYLADSLLVVVDCSRFRGRAREKLFMNSRDRLCRNELRSAIEHELEDVLKNHQGLKELRSRRRQEDTEERLSDAKPLEEVLDSILKKAPTLANLFLRGRRASNPFKAEEVKGSETPFEGSQFPTFFKFKGKDYGVVLERHTARNKRSRISYETDVVNDFFSRRMEAGSFALYRVEGGSRVPMATYAGPNLHDGVATLSVRLPEDVRVGDRITLDSVVMDPSNDREFTNRFTIVVEKETPTGAGSGSRRKPPGSGEGKDREQTAGIALPEKIVEVTQDRWESYDFDKFTGMKIVDSGSTSDEGDSPTQYDFYINMDNLYLLAEMKSQKADVAVLKARFKWAMLLVGLGLLHQHSENTRNDADDDEAINIETQVLETTRALAPVLLPMIDSLGGLDGMEVDAATASGDAV